MAFSPLADLAYDVPVLGPIGIAATLGSSSPVQVLPADNSRRGVIFANVGTQIIRVAPVGALSGGGILIYPQEEEAIFADAELHVNCAWNAIADSGTSNPLTILNFTDVNAAQPRPPMPLARLSYGVPITSPKYVPITNLTGLSSQVIGPNPVRRGILFHNPNPEPVLIVVCPANLVAAAGAGSIGILPGGEKRLVARGRIRVNCGWNAAAALVPNATQPAVLPGANALTILEFL